jgi:hypothetical protein
MIIRAESWEFILKPMVHNTVRCRAAANEQIMDRMAVRTNFGNSKKFGKEGKFMFVENYHQENRDSIVGGTSTAPTIPYPIISKEDWKVWKLFLPVRTMNLDQRAVEELGERGLQFSYGVPADLAPDVRTASKHFEKVEVWRKREVMKDPIVVGVLGDQRYLIARWGMEKLIPFEHIKKSVPLLLAWKYGPPAAAIASILSFGCLIGSGLLM